MGKNNYEINKKCFLKDEEVRSFSKKENLHEFLEERDKSDVWVTNILHENEVAGLPYDAPLLIGEVRNKFPNVIASDEDIETCMKQMGLMLIFPDGDRMVTLPLREIANGSLFERAGLSGRTIRNSGENALPAELKAEWLTKSLSLYDGNAKILIRDGKVSTMRSGEYAVLPANKLVEELETTLGCEYSGYEMLSAEVSHEYLVVRYLIHDTDAEDNLMAALKKCKIQCNDLKLGIKFATSDTGDSSATIYTFINMDGVEIQLDDCLNLRHDSSASIQKWSVEILSKMAMLSRESIKKIKDLANIKIHYPGGCLRNICATIGLPKEPSITTGNNMDAMYMECTALDVYRGIFDVIAANEVKYQNGYTPTQRLKFMEKASTVLSMNFREKDIDFEWKN